MQIFRGKSKEARSIAQAIEYMSNQGPSNEDLYYDYYATQAMFHHGGLPWKSWNYKMRDYLVEPRKHKGTAQVVGGFQGSFERHRRSSLRDLHTA